MEDAIAEEKRDSCDRAELTRELVRRFTYEYPHRYLTELPEKMSVSAMSPTVLDGTEGDSVQLLRPKDPSKRRLPRR